MSRQCALGFENGRGWVRIRITLRTRRSGGGGGVGVGVEWGGMGWDGVGWGGVEWGWILRLPSDSVQHKLYLRGHHSDTVTL